MFSKKDLQRLIIPLIIEQLLAVTIGMADTVMVASVGEAAVSGISLVDSINILLINIFSALATGGAVVASQYLGMKDSKNACTAAKQLLYAATAMAVVLMTAGLIWKNSLLSLVFGNIDSDVMRNAQIYFLLSVISYPFLAVYNSGAALFRAMGNSKISMLTSLLMNLVNISGNAILIFGFHFGVAGAGIASLASRFLGAVIMLILLRNPLMSLHVERMWKPEFHFTMVKKILQIGVPNGLENGMFQVGKILVQSLIADFGTAAIAANAVGNTVASMEILPGSAIGLALITVVGQCVGAKDYDQARSYAIKLMKITYLAMGGLNLVLLISTRPIVGFFGLSPEATGIATELLIYHGIAASIIWPMSFTLPNALRASNDVRFTMMVSVISMWTARIGMSYILGQFLGMGVLGVWIAMFIDWVVRSCLFFWRFHSGRWKDRQLI